MVEENNNKTLYPPKNSQGKLLKSEAKRIKELFRKRKKFLKSYYDVAPFEEPVMFFDKRGGKTEFYEKVTAGMFEFTHSDGSTRFIIVDPNTQRTFGFGNRSFKGYWASEDYPMTGRPDPLLTSEQVNMIVEKSLTDMKKWKAQEKRAQGDMWLKIGLGIAVIIGAYAVFKLLVPTSTEPERIIIQQVTETTPTILG